MKRILQIFVLIITAVQLMTAGGIVHNSNQSATWIRTMVRDASIDVDAVFYNPAGLTRLADGFYIQVNSQTIGQTRDVTSNFALLNSGDFEGTTFVPVLPTGYIAWKKGNLALSAGFTVIGGGGSAEFEAGLPSFETPLAAVLNAPGNAFGANAYDADITFSGSSAYFGYQVGASYAINDMISVALGGRYVTAKNTYTGHIKDIMFNPGGGDLVNANTFFSTTAANLATAKESTDAIVGAGGGSFTLAQLVGAGLITSDQKTQLEGGLISAGIPQAQIDLMTMEMINGAYTQSYNDNYETLLGGAAQTADIEVDAVQKGSTFTPIIGVDLSFADDKIGLAIRYEHLSKMTVENETTKDRAGAPLYPDGEESPAEIPGNLNIGLRFNAMDNFSIQAGMHYYFDNGAKYGRKDDSGNYVTNGEEAVFNGETATLMESNSWEAAIGLEYGITSNIDVSAGFLYAKPSPNAVYQNDISNSQATTTFGLGLGIELTSMLDLDLGFAFTSYDTFEKDVNYRNSEGVVFATPLETYTKSAWIGGIGITAKL
jgi:long-subunit fatty acid transport protein